MHLSQNANALADDSDSTYQPSADSETDIKCKAIYKGGKKKGQRCINNAKHNGFCGIHKIQAPSIPSDIERGVKN